MAGGTVLVAAGNYQISVDQFSGGLALVPVNNGLQDMLASYGVSVDQSLVLDSQNAPFPVQVSRNVGGVRVQEIQAMDYPFFVDVREDGFDSDSLIFSRLSSLTLNWASPLTIDKDITSDSDVSVLMKSSDQSWTTTSLNPQPNTTQYPDFGFPQDGDPKSYSLAVVMQGGFHSFFADKESPFAAVPDTTSEGTDTAEAPATEPTTPLVEVSSPNARLIVIGSSEFLNDNIFQISSQFGGDTYLNALQFVQNTVDWVTEDTDLLSIRSRGSSTRLLDPLTDDKQNFWEGLNYALALISLIVLGALWQWRKRTEQPMPLVETEPPTQTTQELQGDAA